MTPRLAARFIALRMRDLARGASGHSGEAGAFAAAIMTGDRSGMGQRHVARFAGVEPGASAGDFGPAYGAFDRIYLCGCPLWSGAWCPVLALRWPTKKIAAVCRFGGGGVLSGVVGGNVSTERAFIMVAVMLVAVLLDRRGADPAGGCDGGDHRAAVAARSPDRAGISDVICGHDGTCRRLWRHCGGLI